MATKPLHIKAKEVIAQKKRPSQQMELINLRWQQMRLLELTHCQPLPTKAANASFDTLTEEESA